LSKGLYGDDGTGWFGSTYACCNRPVGNNSGITLLMVTMNVVKPIDIDHYGIGERNSLGAFVAPSSEAPSDCCCGPGLYSLY